MRIARSRPYEHDTTDQGGRLRMEQRARIPGPAPCSRGFTAALSVLLALMPFGAHAERLYARDGLTVDRKIQRPGPLSRMFHPTGQPGTSTTWTVAYRRAPLCGPQMGALLFPEAAFQHGRFWCPAQVEMVGNGLIVGFSSGGGFTAAYVSVEADALVVQRIDVSREPRRNTLRTLDIQPTLAPGWSSMRTPWHDTVLLRHAPFAAIPLGEGALLDIDDGIAFLHALPREADRPATLRAVAVDDGRELASLQARRDCLPPAGDDQDPLSTLPSRLREARRDWRRHHLRLEGNDGNSALHWQPPTPEACSIPPETDAKA